MRGIPDDCWRQLADVVSGRSCVLSGWSPGAVFTEATHHGLVPLLDLALHEGRIEGISPLDRELIAGATRLEAAMSLARGHADQSLFVLFEEVGIPLLLLKGAALSRLHYSQSYLRPRCDTDIYVRSSDRPAIERLLTHAGYQLVKQDNRPLTSAQFQAGRERFNGQYLWFDLHLAPNSLMLFRNCLSFHECSRRAQPVEGLPDTVQALSNVHLLLHTALHRLGHGRGRQRNRLIWLYDLHLLYQALESTEHDDMVSLALSERLGCITSAALRHCQDAFGTPVTEDWLTRLESRRSEEPVARLENAAAWRLLLSDLAEQSSMRERWQFACEVLANRMGLR